ncbi:MAG: hypothetical protein GXY03_06090 [Solirubrobacterales bacterium]|nr:hypothetical protein [Solirubrobacterales bacterium]
MSGEPAVEQIRRRIADLEERVARLEGDGGVAAGDGAPAPATDGSEPSAYVRELIAAGQKVAAIDAYRKEAGVGIKDAKRRIDELAG